MDAPRAGDGLLAQLDGLSPAKRALLEQRLREARSRASSAGGIARGTDDEPAPLSFAQELLWRLEQAAPGTSTYNVPRAMHVAGEIDVARLQRALDALVARHAILRTTIAGAEGEQRLVAGAARPVKLDVVDISALPAAARKDEALRLLREAASVPFDLSRDLLLRATLVRMDEEEHALLLVSHHIASDGSSGGIMMRDLDALYRGETLAPPAIQFADFARWQRGQLTAERIEGLRGYWRQRLAGAPARLELPTDRARPLAPSFDGARETLLLGRELGEAVQACARAHATTPFVVLLAAFEVLLHRYSRQDDIVVGTVVTGRSQPEVDGVVGYFSNTLPLRVTFEGAPTFADVVGRVRDASLGANEHAELPYETIALELRAGRNGDSGSLFDVMFAMIDESAAPAELGDAMMMPIPLDRGVSKFDLTIGPAFTDEGLRVGMEYRTDLFDAATIQRMLSHYGVLLAAATKGPETAALALPLLPAAERDLVINEWNATEVTYPAQATLVSLLADQTARTPDAVAVSLAADPAATLSFAELDARATTLARALVSRGVHSGVLVGVCMERSLELVVALVAIIKAGGAYVPLDPEYPADRLAYMIADAKCPVLLVQERIRDTVLAGLAAGDVAVICVDGEWNALESEPAADLPAVQPDDLAYMIYTSGSTGKPKGALNRHRGIVNRLLWMQGEYELGASDAVLQKTPFSFDVSVWEFFLPLLAGAQLVMAEPGGHRDPAYLAEVIRERRITVLHFVPSMLRAFLEEPAAALTGETLRDVMCSGEALPYDLVQRFFAIVGGNVGLHNLYGPTECAVDVSYWECRRDDERRTIPIGRPVANTQLYVLDELMQPVPIGVAGELYLGGVQVGAGYWGRPELTSERFVTDIYTTWPAPGVDPARLYKTGDLARWLPDGAVEYLGRLDFQVKLRGFRIELGEIESAISAHPGVREVVVVAREDLPGGAALIAYYSVRDGVRPSPTELRAILRGSLPEYMVPAAFVELPTLPLSPSGKVDRKALPVPMELAPAEVEHVAPRHAAEEQVAAIWREVLAVEDVGIHDDFFDAGGHSLLAMRVAGRIHAATGVRITFRELFTLRTVEAQAARISAASSSPVHDDRIERRAELSWAPLSFAQEMLWLQAQMAPESATYNVPMALRVHGAVDAARLRAALAALAQRHESLRTSFEEGDDGPRQRIAESVRVKVLDVDFSSWEDDEREEAALTSARRAAVEPFDVTRAPLLRVNLVRLAPDDAILVLVAHHIVFDGGSIGVLLDELFALYESPDASLPPLGAQYGDYAAWQRTHLAGARLETLREFWKGELAGAPDRVSLPADPAARGSAREGRRVEGRIASSSLTTLRRIGREKDATLYMTLLAAFQSLLHLATGDVDIVVGSPVSGREREEVARTIGYFANTLPMRAQFQDDDTFATLLERVRDAALRAYEHQEMPYEQMLLDRITPGAGAEATLFSTLFVQQDDAAHPRTLGGAEAVPVTVALDSAKFDVALSVRDDGDALHASLHYRADLISDAAAQALFDRYARLLDAIAERPDARLRELEGGSVAPPAAVASPETTRESGEYLSPDGPVEEVIAGVWSEMLGRPAIGRDDRFFDVGGHSLLATRIVARVSSLLRARIPIRAFFADPTIRGMAVALQAVEEKPGQTAAVARAVLKLRGMSPAERATLAAARTTKQTHETT